MKDLISIPNLVLSGFIIFVLGFVGAGIYESSRSGENEELPINAGFRIYIDDVLQDYSNADFARQKPCNNENSPIFITSEFSDVVFVESENQTWQDLFDALKINLADFPRPVIYANRLNAPDLLTDEINNLDSAIFILGESQNLNKINDNYVQERRILKAAESKNFCK